MARKNLGDLLIEAGALDQGGLTRALREQAKWGRRLGEILLELGLIKESDLVSALSKQLRVSVVNLSELPISSEVLALVDKKIAADKQVLPFQVEGAFLDLAMSDPQDVGIMDELRLRTRLNVRPYLAGPRAMATALERHYGIPRSESSGVYDIEAISGGASIGLEGAAGSRGSAESDDLRKFVSQLRDRQRVLEQHIYVLQERLAKTESLLDRDEGVIRQLMKLLVDKGVATREEVLSRIS